MAGSPQQLALSLEKHRNHYLFSDYYLDNLLPKRLDWQKAGTEAQAALKQLQETYAAFTPTENEAQTEQDWIRPVFEALGHVFEVQPSIATPDGTRRPDYVFFPNVEARNAAKPLQGKDGYAASALAVGDAKFWERSLDQTLQVGGGKSHDPFTNKNPSWQIYFYMLHTGRAWGILTNGRAWRLYHKDSAHKLDYYYEADLPALLESGEVEAFNYFFLFFRQAAFIPNGAGRTWLDTILQESRDYAQGVGEDLKDQVYEALRHLAQGFLDYPGNDLKPNPATLKAIHDNSLILLYRLLFVLYAESRALLPLQDNETYRQSYSLDAIKKEIERSLGKPILTTSRFYWTRLQELFEAIDHGNPTLGVPSYNGDLFDTQQHPFLAKHTVGDQELREAIDLLARTDTSEGRVFVDYRDLEVRHLGSIYEGLLEYQLRYAEQDLAVVKEKGRQRYVPAAQGQAVHAPAHRVYLVTDRGERKATGSYYTPDYIVKYIVQQTVQPLLDEAFARWAERKTAEEGALVNEILSLNVLDPAMGSGHFLVEATEHIARYLVGVGLQATSGMGAEAELDYWKRRVVQACIYGVDLNPLAVELAKLSLWLVTVSRDKPLSFLDHHLRCGNSLIGARVADPGAEPAAKKPGRKVVEQQAAGQLSMFDDDAFRQSMMTAVDGMWLIEEADSSTLQGVKQQERSYQQLREELTGRYRRLADLWTARHFGVEMDSAMWPGLVAYATGRAPAQVPQYEGLLKQAAAVAEEKRFFHWELEFPEVFFDRFGNGLKEQAGFDAVVGNPPYLILGNYEQDEAFFGFAYKTSGYKTDYYMLFVERGLELTSDSGRFSQIFPNRFAHTKSGRGLRVLLGNYTVLSILDFGTSQVFEGVINYVLIPIIAKRKPDRPEPPEVAYRLADAGSAEAAREFKIASQCLSVDGWRIVRFEEELLLRRFRESSLPLSAIARDIFAGLQTGADRILVVPTALAQQSHLEGALLRRFLKGRHIRRFELAWDDGWLVYPYDERGAVYDERVLLDEFPNVWRYLEEHREQLAARVWFGKTPFDVSGKWYGLMYAPDRELFGQPKILCPYLSQRATFSFDTEASLFGAGAGYGIFLKQDCLLVPQYVLAVLNSRLCAYRFAQISPRFQAGYKHNEVYISQLPIRAVAFTTPEVQRVRLGQAGIMQSAEFVERTEESLSASLDAFGASALGLWLSGCLPVKPDGRPDTEHEQSDVVHDLLAHLAEQMADMHKRKQEEVHGFLAWLVAYTGLTADDWTLKSTLRCYCEQDWPGMRNLLDRNARKIKKVNVQGREASEMVQTEWKKSVEKLSPLLARIAATDRLIDLIVYRLYGLTEEEVALVEGATGNQG